MSRLVDPRPRGAARFAAAGAPAKDWAERTAKYVPSEVLAGYLAASGFIAALAAGRLRLGLYLFFLVLGTILTPAYLRKMAKPKQPKRLHMRISTIAFLVWAYSFGGPFADLHVYHPTVASLALIAFSMISGAFAPVEGDP